jgi:4a-hydroxytetrahydrobiopterin dehydratase
MHRMSAPLSDAELKAFLAANPGWSVDAGMLVRTFEASSFLSGLAFVQKVAHAAEAADHHPDIDIRWRKVTLRLVTHDAGNAITALDAQLAAGASRLFNGH